MSAYILVATSSALLFAACFDDLQPFLIDAHTFRVPRRGLDLRGFHGRERVEGRAESGVGLHGLLHEEEVAHVACADAEAESRADGDLDRAERLGSTPLATRCLRDLRRFHECMDQRLVSRLELEHAVAQSSHAPP